MNISDEILKELAYVQMSRHRTKIMETLKKEPEIPSKIAKKSGINPNNVSNTIKQLRNHELVECVNPEYKMGRLYRLTDKGKNVAENLEIRII